MFLQTSWKLVLLCAKKNIANYRRKVHIETPKLQHLPLWIFCHGKRISWPNQKTWSEDYQFPKNLHKDTFFGNIIYLAGLMKQSPSLMWPILKVKDFLCQMDESTISFTLFRKKEKHNHLAGNSHISFYEPEITEKWIVARMAVWSPSFARSLLPYLQTLIIFREALYQAKRVYFLVFLQLVVTSETKVQVSGWGFWENFLKRADSPGGCSFVVSSISTNHLKHFEGEWKVWRMKKQKGAWVADNYGPGLPALNFLPPLRERKGNVCLFNVTVIWVFCSGAAKTNINWQTDQVII